MTFLRAWRILCIKQFGEPSQRPFCVILERRGRQDALHFESGAITYLNQQDFSLIKDNFSRIDDVFCCLGIYRSLTYDSALQSYLSFLVTVTDCHLVGKLPRCEVYRITGVNFSCLNKQLNEDDANNEVCYFAN